MAEGDFANYDPVTAYEKLGRVGEGTFGVVYKARETATGEIVALKRVRMDREKDGLPLTSVRELRVLEACTHPNIVQLKKVVTGSKADAVFLVLEFCPYDMGRIVDQRRHFFSLPEIKCLLQQLLAAVAHLHSCWVMHRDLKMTNLLYTHTGQLKVCDFGLARYFFPYDETYTPKVVTLWYRAPEVLLGAGNYTESLDLWSVGCIMVEWLQNKPLFPGQSEIECLGMMSRLLGSPNTKIWPGMADLPGVAGFQFPKQPYNYIKQRLPMLSAAGVELLNRLLTFDPARRITAKEALRHRFFQESPQPKHPSAMPGFVNAADKPASRDAGRDGRGGHRPSRVPAQDGDRFGGAFDTSGPEKKRHRKR